MDKKYEIFPIIEGLYMTWFTVEFVFRFLSSPSKVSIKNTIIKLTIFKICFKDSIHEEVDERDRLYCRDALLYQPNFLQVSFLYKFRNKQAQALSQTPFVPSKGLNMEMKLVSDSVTFSFHRSLSAS